jgi:hypothetical protein
MPGQRETDENTRTHKEKNSTQRVRGVKRKRRKKKGINKKEGKKERTKKRQKYMRCHTRTSQQYFHTPDIITMTRCYET